MGRYGELGVEPLQGAHLDAQAEQPAHLGRGSSRRTSATCGSASQLGAAALPQPGRYREMWRGMARYGEMWRGMARYGEVWECPRGRCSRGRAGGAAPG